MQPDTRRVVLVVDDEPMLTRAMGRLLGNRYIVRTANSAEEARSIIRVARVDVVVSDFDMGPGLNGGQFLEWAKVAHPAIRRVLCTGNLNARAESAHVVLSKPAIFDDLVSAIEGE